VFAQPLREYKIIYLFIDGRGERLRPDTESDARHLLGLNYSHQTCSPNNSSPRTSPRWT
jgi:hypothetical protein